MPHAQYRSRGFYSAYFPPGVKWLLISTTGVFVLTRLLAALHAYSLLAVFDAFKLVPEEAISGWIWQFVTYLFLHGGVLHILFNMLTLWMFGADLERDWGTKRFLQYYFICGIGAGLGVVLVNFLTGYSRSAVIGASGAIYGVLLAYGVLYPDRIVLAYLLFPMKAKYLVLLYGAMAFLGSLEAPGSGISHLAHLSGMVVGYIYLRSRLHVKRRRDLIGSLRRQYQDWKIRRARKKFQVYMRKHDRDRWVH